MKKTILEAACALTLLLAACSTSPEKKAVKIINDATEQMEKAESYRQIDRIEDRIDAELYELTEKYPALNEIAEDTPEIVDALDLYDIAKKKARRRAKGLDD